MADRCKNCALSKKAVMTGASVVEVRECHRNPPSIIPQPVAPDTSPSRWPRVLDDDWCSRWTAKD